MKTPRQALRDSKTARWTALAILSFSMFCGYFLTDAMAPLKGMLEEKLTWSSSEYGLFTSAYGWFNVFLFFLIIGGIIADKMGVRFSGLMSASIMVAGTALKYWAVSTHTLDGQVWHILWLDIKAQVFLAALGFAIFGVGIEVAAITVSKIIVKWFSGKEMALAMGLEMSFARLGTGLAIGTSLPIARAFDKVSAPVLLALVLLCIGLICFIIYTFLDKKLDAEDAAMNKAQAVTSSEEPFRMSDIWKIFTSRGWWYIAILCVLFYSAVFPFLKYAQDLMVNKFGVAEKLAGAIPMMLPFGTIILTPFFGNLYDRKGKGATIMLVGAVILVFVHSLFSIPFLNQVPVAIFLTVVLGIGFSLVPSAMWPSLPKIINEKQLGTAYSMIFWVQNWGVMGVPALIGWVLDKYCITGQVMKNGIQMNLYNYTIPMLIFTSLGILAVVFGLLLKREDKKKGFGLELPNIKSGLGIIALILLGSVIPGNAGAQTAPTEISVRDQNSIAGKNSPMAEKRMRSWAHHQELKNSSQFKDLTWRAVGPEYIGGRIQSIACHPKNPFTIYTGVGSGNLWKTENNGITWTPVFEHESSFAIGCVTIAPSDPEIVWVGTGEVLMARSSYSGTGVFKSTDGGKTWQHMGLAGTNHIGKVVIDPGNPDIVYVAAIGRNFGQNEERGLYKTTDGGKTWTKVLYVSDRAGVVDVVMSPDDSKTLLAVSWERDRKPWNNLTFGPGSAVYKTSDAGASWIRLTKGLPTGEFIGRTGLAISSSNPKIVYALVDNQNPGPEGRKKVGGELYRSSDRGETWNKMNTNDIPTAVNSDYCIVMVSPDNENEIYLLGNKLIRSTDGGKTYTPTGETILHLLPHDIRVMHLDMHAMWIDPFQPDHLLLGNDGGLYSSYDRGTTWLHLNNMPIGEFYAVSVDNATPYNIYGGTQDNAAVFGPSDYVITDRFTQYGVVSPWKNVYLDQWGGGDSYFTEPDPTDADVIYYEHQFGEIIRKNMKTGETAHIQPEAGKDEPPLRFNWMSPYLISAFDPNVLYFGTQKLMKSYDRGDHWIAISPDLTTDPGPEKQGNVPFGTLTTISESPLRQGLLYAGTDDGNMHVTLDDGKTWTKIDQSLPDKWLTRVRASRHAVSTVYACLTGYREDDIESYLYVSDDNGQSWNPIKGNLPAESVNVIVEDPRSPDILYIGTDLGVYVTLNRGKVWTSLCNNLPTAAVYDLALQSRDLELVAATHGRSIFILNIKDIVKK